jgi:predicted nucleic-acid-binding Zn-ribbon protein
MSLSPNCPECSGTNLYATEVSSGGGHAPNFLPGLGGFLSRSRFDVVVCSDCGLTRLFAQESALSKLRTARAWHRISV